MSETSDLDPKAEGERGIGASGPQPFQAEVARILQLMVHSVYTERAIFLRELISNASDALDKLRYLTLTQPELGAGRGDLAIRITPDAAARTLTVADTGIGMSRQELIDNLGTIARSGTKAFLDGLAVSDKGGLELIGQFGVGFYAAFMVADRVEVTSRRAGSAEAFVWTSDGINGFEVAPAVVEEAFHGTAIRLHMKEDAGEFLEAGPIERAVRTYSDHIAFPIRLVSGEGEPRQLNRASALWTRPKSEVGAEDYTELYRHLSGQPDEPALTVHYRAEGRSEYAVLLFVPSRRPFSFGGESRKSRVRLYVRRVHITDEAELLPPFLRFVEGVVDSQDMPLNISRELLQNNPHVAAMRKALTGRVLSELVSFAGKEPERWLELWAAFGAVLKEGLYEAPDRRDALLDLARFRSTVLGAEGWRSLKQYVADLKTNQTAIYLITGESFEQIAASPQLEGFKARGIEVLLMTDPIDAFWTVTALGYDGKPFRSVTQGEAEISAIPLASEGGSEAAATPETVRLVEQLRKTLGEAVSEVRVSKRLVDSPACLVASDMGPDRGLEKLLARQQRGLGLAPVLEINPGHRLVKALEQRLDDAGSEGFEDLAWLLLDQARILEGELPADPAKFAQRMNRSLLPEA